MAQPASSSAAKPASSSPPPSPPSSRSTRGPGALPWPGVWGVSPLLPPIPLLFPGIPPHVVPVALPEAGGVLGEKLQAAHPLGALPEVEVRHDQPQRSAVLRGQRLAAVPVGE